MPNQIREPWETNRQQARKPKEGKARYWCFGCDACLVSPGQKCKNCGKPERHYKAPKRDFRN